MAPSKYRSCFAPRQWWSYDGDVEDREGTLMWVYRQDEVTERWVVGYYLPDRSFFTESSYADNEKGRLQAAERVHWLNGGDK